VKPVEHLGKRRGNIWKGKINELEINNNNKKY
jgi:hypothetical protein